MYKYKFTIYTPIYNRGKLIYRVFDSIAKQTFRDFEWLIINDGSTDNSSEIIKELIRRCDWDVQFFDFDTNIGFNKSMNFAVSKSKGELFLFAHGDDAFIPEALEILYKNWISFPEDVRKKLQGVKCNCIDQNGHLIGDKFPESPWISDIFDINFNYKIKGEKWGFIKTDIMKEFPFPEEEKFVYESYIWYKMYAKYPAIFINDTLRIYFTDFNENNLSVSTANKRKFSFSKRLIEKDFINHYLKRIKGHFIFKVKVFIKFWSYTFLSKISIKQSLEEINSLKQKLISIIFIPFGYLHSKF